MKRAARPGRDKASRRENLVRFGHILGQRLRGAEVRTTSVAIAFYLMLSIFPLLIAVGNLLPLLGLELESAMGYIAVVVPSALVPTLEPIIRSLLGSSSGGLLSVGIIAAIWSASRGIVYIRKGLNKAYGVPDSSSYIVKKVVSVLTILLILLLLIAFALVFSFSGMVLGALEPTFPWAGQLLWQVTALKWPVALVFAFLLLVLVYRVTPDVKLRLRDVLPGAAFATVGLLLLVRAFSLFLEFSTRQFSSYGALASFFVLMFWLNFSAGILLLGAVLNATIGEYRHGAAVGNISGMDAAIERTKQSLKQRLMGLVRKKKPAPPVADPPDGDAPDDGADAPQKDAPEQ